MLLNWFWRVAYAIDAAFGFLLLFILVIVVVPWIDKRINRR